MKRPSGAELPHAHAIAQAHHIPPAPTCFGVVVPTRSRRTPSYRLHEPSGQSVDTLDGRDIYLGPFASAASRAEYDRLIAEWLSNDRAPTRTTTPDGLDLTVNELLLAFVHWTEAYYRKGGRSTGEVTNIKRTALDET